MPVYGKTWSGTFDDSFGMGCFETVVVCVRFCIGALLNKLERTKFVTVDVFPLSLEFMLLI